MTLGINRGSSDRPDAVVVGAGPNGLSAAIELARAGRSVTVLEAEGTIGGGCRTAELTLPGYRHDICAAVHPLAAMSPFFASLALARYGVEWVQPDRPLAHPLDDGTAVTLERDVAATGDELGGDAAPYMRLMAPFMRDAGVLADGLLGPLRVPRHPVPLARFARQGLRSGTGLATGTFRTERARALFGGLAAHAMLPLDRHGGAAVAIVLAIAAHRVGWPWPRGGSGRLADALATHLRDLGGEIVTGRRVTSLKELPASRAVFLDLTPRQVLAMGGTRLPSGYRGRLARFRYGPGVFKLDWALDGPIPWTASACLGAGTVHVGGSLAEIVAAEAAVGEGRAAEHPFVILAQPSLFDHDRAPAGGHTAWAYCHVPAGSTEDMTSRIEMQIERFAPGFRDRIRARSVLAPVDLERLDGNHVGGDIGGGALDLRQLIARPVLRVDARRARLDPYATPDPSLFICSSSTPPGGGVHGMCGYHAARSALGTRLR